MAERRGFKSSYRANLEFPIRNSELHSQVFFARSSAVRRTRRLAPDWCEQHGVLGSRAIRLLDGKRALWSTLVPGKKQAGQSMDTHRHLGLEELSAGLDRIAESPADQGVVEMIVRRPGTDEREVLDHAALDTEEGLIGDNWLHRGSSRTADGSAHPEMQLNLMNARVIALVAGTKARWPLAGDQLFVDLDLSKENLPAGTKLEIGSAIIEVTSIPHMGCKKFVERFGLDAMKFVNSGLGKRLCLRGINARVVQSGTFSVGDLVSRLA